MRIGFACWLVWAVICLTMLILSVSTGNAFCSGCWGFNFGWAVLMAAITFVRVCEEK